MTSKIKVDNINKVSDDSNIIKKCGSTITIGSCGASVALASGATQTGFGRTGTVDWCTTAKTSPLTVASGNGYFINTTSGGITVTLPSSPSAGDIIALKDYGNTWDTNNVTLCRNGSKINGNCSNATLNTESQSVTLIYVDGTKGWQDIQDSTSDVTGASFTSATGGTITTSGNFKIHTFTSSGCFAVSSVGNAAGGGDKVSYMVVAGGGGGSTGGGGAGGFREGKDTPIDSYTASPLAAADSGLTINNTTYPITVGAGGVGPSAATPGSNSIFSSITSTGGGAGGSSPFSTPTYNGAPGGSGGGANQGAAAPAPNRPAQGGAGNTPPVSPSQGFPGGNSNSGDQTGSGGGGGATAAGGNSTGPAGPGSGGIAGPGGAGATTSINASPNSFAGGGGGNQYSPTAPAVTTPGGVGGGGTGSYWNGSVDTGATDGTANTGGGGGGTAGSGRKNGGSGIVIIRYKFQ